MSTLPRINCRHFLGALLALAILGGPARAACGDAGDPGYRGPDGACVSWCELERVCGKGRGSCAAENPNRTVLTLQAIRKGDPSLPACKGCGCKGGPGYRKPNGRCSGWDELAAACGDPPTTRCRAEIVQPNADAAAQAQAEYGRLTSACR